MKEKIVVLDFESKNLHLITKRLRKLGYYTEIACPNTNIAELENVKGFVFASQNEAFRHKYCKLRGVVFLIVAFYPIL